MTLVVATCIDNKISIVADTTVSTNQWLQTAKEINPPPSALKAIILNPNTCICYAGTVDYAVNAIRQIKPQIDGMNIDQILDFLLSQNCHRDIDIQPDYIVAHFENSVGTLSKIQNGIVEKNLTNCWIGSLNAFGKYQNAFHAFKAHLVNQNPELPGWKTIKASMMRAMSEIIDNDLDETVGGFVVPVSSTAQGFKYMTHSFTTVPSQSIPPQEWTTLRLGGNSAEGAYSCVLLRPTERNAGAIGIYLYQPRLGLFFYPLELNSNLLLKGGTYQQFVDYIKAEYQITLEGIKMG